MVSVILYPCMFCVGTVIRSVCYVCCVSDSVSEFFCETIPNMFGFGCYFVVECNCVVWVLFCIDCVWSFKECVCCAYDPSVRLDDPSICFVCVLYVGIYHLFKSLRAG